MGVFHYPLEGKTEKSGSSRNASSLCWGCARFESCPGSDYPDRCLLLFSLSLSLSCEFWASPFPRHCDVQIIDVINKYLDAGEGGEGSLWHLQQSANCPSPEPDRSSTAPPSRMLKIHFNIILQSYARVFQVVSFP